MSRSARRCRHDPFPRSARRGRPPPRRSHGIIGGRDRASWMPSPSSGVVLGPSLGRSTTSATTSTVAFDRGHHGDRCGCELGSTRPSPRSRRYEPTWPNRLQAVSPTWNGYRTSRPGWGRSRIGISRHASSYAEAARTWSASCLRSSRSPGPSPVRRSLKAAAMTGWPTLTRRIKAIDDAIVDDMDEPRGRSTRARASRRSTLPASDPLQRRVLERRDRPSTECRPILGQPASPGGRRGRQRPHDPGCLPPATLTGLIGWVLALNIDAVTWSGARGSALGEGSTRQPRPSTTACPHLVDDASE